MQRDDHVRLSELECQAGFARLEQCVVIQVTGEDRTSFLQNFCTNDVSGCSSGHGCEAFVTDAKGHVLSHLIFLVKSDAIWAWSRAGNSLQLIQHWDRYCITEDVQFEDLSSTAVCYTLWGTTAGTVLGSMGLDVGNAFYSHANREAEPQCTAARFATAEPPAFLAILDSAEHVSTWDATLLSQGAIRSSETAFRILCMEHGFPVYGEDVLVDNLPQEVNRNELAISFRKGCYLGQETVARIDALGHVNRLLVPLRLQVDGPVSTGDSLFTDDSDRPVGKITSLTWSPRHKGHLALAYVRPTFAKPGMFLQCGDGTAEVVPRRHEGPA